MKQRVNRFWNDLEKYQLWLAYEVKTPLLIMEEHFCRSVTSINKFLSFSGIRNKSPRYISGNEPTVTIKTLEDLQRLFVECGLDKDSVGLEREITRQWRPCGYTLRKLREFDLTLPFPWADMPKIDRLPVKSGIGRKAHSKLGLFVSMEVVASYLTRRGVNIKRLNNRPHFGWTFQIDNKPATDSLCLMKANIERYYHGQPVFMVKGLTEE